MEEFGQINSCLKVLEDLKLKEKIEVFGLVKDDKHRTKELINKERVKYELSDKIMNLFTNLQNEIHKTAIEYHRKLRDKEIVSSKLDNIKGIGETRKKLLLKEFKTIENISKQSIQSLCKIKGINEKMAEEILKKLKEMV